jgi:hypothetical protein
MTEEIPTWVVERLQPLLKVDAELALTAEDSEAREVMYFRSRGVSWEQIVAAVESAFEKHGV